MHNSLPNIYCFINDLDQRYIKNLEKKIGIIYRNYDNKINSKDIINFGKLCKKNRRKFYIANEFKLAISANLDGVYIPSFNKSTQHLSYSFKRKFVIIGSAHNIKEIRFKEKQHCDSIFLSPIFKTNKSKKNLGIFKFRILKNYTNKKVIALGGINEKNLKLIKKSGAIGFASISYIKKNGPKINLRAV